MSRNDRNSNTRPQVPGAQERASAPPARTPVEEDLGSSQAKVVSMGHVELFSFTVEGEIFDSWMPRIARSADGLIPTLPCRDLDTGEDCLLIVPGSFNSWLRKNKPARGTRLRLTRKGVDENTGAWKLSVARL